MAAGDLIIGEQSQGDGSLIGYAQGVAVAVPAAGTTPITSNDTASWVAAMETANTRVVMSSGVRVSPTSQVDPASGVQNYCPDGAFTIDGAGVSEILINAVAENLFIGNVILEPSIGVADQGNNPGIAMELSFGKSANDTAGRYMFGVELRPNADIHTMSGDRPEGFDSWIGSTAYTTLVTLHSCSIPSAYEFSNSKFLTAGSDTTDGASGHGFTMYRCYAYVWKRFPLMGDAMSLDMVNCVIPDMTLRRETAAQSRDSNTKLDLRANYVYGNEIITQAEVQDNGSGTVYYVTSGGAGNDDNFEVNSPVIDLSPAQTTTRIGAYTGRPTSAAMDGTLQTAIEAEVAGTYAITQESPPDTLDPLSAGHIARMSFENEFSPTVQFVKMEVYEQRWRETQSYGFFYRWNNAAKCLVKEWTADWPGLNPHAGRGYMYLPTRTQFGGA